MTKQIVKNFFIVFITMVFIGNGGISYAQDIPLLGDVNDDASITIIDALLIARYYVGLSSAAFVSEAADVNADFSVTIVDALLVAQYYVGLISQFPGQTITGMEVVESDLVRNVDPQLESGELDSVAEGNNRFGFDFLQILKEEPGNLFFSPLSISYAFAMCYAGSGGATETEIAGVMHFTLPTDRFHNAFNALDTELTSEPLNPVPEMGKELKLYIANSIWGQKDYYFYPDFLDILAINYGAGIHTVDFNQYPEQCRVLINDWVSDQTEERITNLLPAGSITPLTRLVLTNAIYFKANWYSPFNEENTYDEDFYLANGSSITIPMMHKTETISYYEVSGQYQAVRLIYQGIKSNSMILILPAEGQLSTFESGFTYNTFNEIRQGMTTYRVILTFPKFSYEWGDTIKTLLQELGMTESFTADADFTGITNEERLFIGDVIHKSFVSVDEIGTEAAAATAVIMPGSAGPEPTPTPPPVVTMTVNRPFYFIIFNNNTQTILFLGRVSVP